MRFRKSLPTRGAWIEISVSTMSFPYQSVAPHAGSVDRNERYYGIDGVAYVVAPHAGSVDRNVDAVTRAKLYIGRSPRGERG